MRKKYSEEQIRKRERLIRAYVNRGYSANKIQRQLIKHGLGIRRKVLLSKIRKAKRVRPEPARRMERYIPRKYEPRVKWRRRAEKLMPLYIGKEIAVYGTVNGKSRRIELSGTGRALYNAMLLVGKHPPKRRFARARAVDVVENRHKYLDIRTVWDEHPEVKS